MKVFITSSSGVGKTAVIHELKNRGYIAYDVDDRQLKLTRFVTRTTGELATWPKGYVDWRHYAWNGDETRLKELLSSADKVFIAGFLDNQEGLYHYFDKLIVLSVNRQEHERRLRNRPKRQSGDEEENIRQRLEKYPIHLTQLKASGFKTIDNSGPVSITVDKIEQIVANSN